MLKLALYYRIQRSVKVQLFMSRENLVSNALNLFYQLESKESSVWKDNISIMEYSF